MEKIALKIKDWIAKNKKEALLLGLILLVAAFFRLYKISEYMTFLGDEGRDVIIVRRIFTELHPPLVGPGTSIGNMYLGPLYYYMMAPALLLAGMSPVGPAVQIALLGVLTVFLVWFVAREWFPSTSSGPSVAGLVAAALYAIAPTVIIYSRSSWNPNIMPFFALLSIYSIWQVWSSSAKASEGQAKSYRWLIVLGFSFAFVMQSHYLGLLLLPTLGIFWLAEFLRLRRGKAKISEFIKLSIIGMGIFAILMSPLVIFDARHGWRNFAAIKKFFSIRQETVSARPWNAAPKIYPLLEKINTRLVAGRNEKSGRLVAVSIILGLGWAALHWRNMSTINRKSYVLNLIWLGFALIGLGLYKQEIYDHYYGFFFAAPFLLLGGITQSLIEKNNKILKFSLALVIAFLVVVNLADNPLRYAPNKQLERSQTVAKKILEEANTRSFNLAVLAERNYEDGYKYFLLVWGAKVLHADRWDKNTIADSLFVVCEMPKEKCDPTHSPKAEVANFGWSKIENQWDVSGVTLYKLVHSR